LAGLGWIGKNTKLINRRLGSWLFLATLLTSEELEYDRPTTVGHCGSCRACLDACPTGALVEARTLDARRCIGYLTVEIRGDVPSEFHQPMGDRLLGCDACQEVCPWNRRAPATSEEAFWPLPEMNPLELSGLFGLDEDAFRARFRHTPLWRSKRCGILRNAAIVLGNHPHAEAIPALTEGINDAETTVRAASARALGRHADHAARDALENRLTIESDAGVRGEIESALDHLRHSETRAPEQVNPPIHPPI
jgi:epoxyqueuosine reductase